MEQPIPVADLIILIASGTARVEYFNEQIDSFISSTNKNLPENLFAAAYPVTYLQLKQGIASTALVADSTTNISESQRVLIRPHPIPPFETVTGLDGNKNPHLSWISTEFKLSPNVATLFHANTLIRSHLSPTVPALIATIAPNGLTIVSRLTLNLPHSALAGCHVRRPLGGSCSRRTTARVLQRKHHTPCRRMSRKSHCRATVF